MHPNYTMELSALHNQHLGHIILDRVLLRHSLVPLLTFWSCFSLSLFQLTQPLYLLGHNLRFLDRHIRYIIPSIDQYFHHLICYLHPHLQKSEIV